MEEERQRRWGWQKSTGKEKGTLGQARKGCGACREQGEKSGFVTLPTGDGLGQMVLFYLPTPQLKKTETIAPAVFRKSNCCNTPNLHVKMFKH